MIHAKMVHVVVRISVADFILCDSDAWGLAMKRRAMADIIAQRPVPTPMVAAAHNAEAAAFAPAASSPDADIHP